jgi:hypothetical protein
VYFRHFCATKDDNFSTNMFVMTLYDFRRHLPVNVTSIPAAIRLKPYLLDLRFQLLTSGTSNNI